MGTNIKYKDSVFSFLFSNEDTLRDVLFMEQINDISFEIGGRLVILIEHQSTINPNMALRLLMYAGRVYEKIVKGNKKNVHTGKPVEIPRPEFYVLYNGSAPYPPKKHSGCRIHLRMRQGSGCPEKAPPPLSWK